MLAHGMKFCVRFKRLNNAAAAGQTTITSSALDMAENGGWRNVTFLVLMGSITSGAATSAKVQQSSDDGSSDAYSDLEGTSITIADTDDNKIIPIHIVRPTKRYLKVVISRATQDSVLDGIVAMQYDGNALPPTNDSTTAVAGELHVSPAEGTA